MIAPLSCSWTRTATLWCRRSPMRALLAARRLRTSRRRWIIRMQRDTCPLARRRAGKQLSSSSSSRAELAWQQRAKANLSASRKGPYIVGDDCAVALLVSQRPLAHITETSQRSGRRPTRVWERRRRRRRRGRRRRRRRRRRNPSGGRALVAAPQTRPAAAVKIRDRARVRAVFKHQRAIVTALQYCSGLL
eukprot:COSAG06_NODE_3582_length_5154_cov_38.356083_2_plen_191_part_00